MPPSTLAAQRTAHNECARISGADTVLGATCGAQVGVSLCPSPCPGTCRTWKRHFLVLQQHWHSLTNQKSRQWLHWMAMKTEKCTQQTYTLVYDHHSKSPFYTACLHRCGNVYIIQHITKTYTCLFCFRNTCSDLKSVLEGHYANTVQLSVNKQSRHTGNTGSLLLKYCTFYV